MHLFLLNLFNFKIKNNHEKYVYKECGQSHLVFDIITNRIMCNRALNWPKTTEFSARIEYARIESDELQ